MANFKTAFNLTMGHEGGYVFDPLDRGGETYRGIARQFHPNWEGWGIIDGLKSLDGKIEELVAERHGLLSSHVEGFYKKQFWDRLRLDALGHQKIAEELFDTAVNMGVSVAGRFLQRSVNLTNRNAKDAPDLVVDGRIGAKSLAAFDQSEKNWPNILKTLNILQGARYIDIVERNPSQERFFNGWLNRVSL